MTTAKKTAPKKSPVSAAPTAPVYAEKSGVIDVLSITPDELRLAGVQNGMTDEQICEAVARIRG